MNTRSGHYAQPLISNLIHRSGTREIKIGDGRSLVFYWSYYFESRGNQTLVWHYNASSLSYDLVWRIAGELTLSELDSWLDRTNRDKQASSNNTLQTS